ncbi:unnamed protein product [Candidula unifasciata]|uniref:Uncharacterized protein n=1 Tax=Candidula unifasciata TaxID=100452 RepID=A0A8S3YWW6_9EUPU|nr:unnamed protein product [Candidula unifasciata]
MGDYARTHSNLTRDEGSASLEPSVWSLVKGNLEFMIRQAFRRTQLDKFYSNKAVENVRNLTLRLEHLLEGPLKDVAPGHNVGKTIHQKVEEAVKGAVGEAMNEQNDTNAFTSNVSLVSLKDRLVVTLESEIELDVFNKVLTNHTGGFRQEEDENSSFLHSLHLKDETMFVVLVSMAIIIPGIFISLLIFFFYRRQNDAKERRQEMLLQDQPEFSMDEYNTEDRQPSLRIEIPDLDLHNLKI